MDLIKNERVNNLLDIYEPLLTNKQKEIIESDAERIVVLSRAASGKTAVLTERARHLLQKGVDPKEIAVITFTNLAA